MPTIHSTAVVESGAQIASDAIIGPYCVVGPHVAIGDGCHLIAHVHVTGHTTIGARTVIYPFASLGTPPQSLSYRGGPTRLVVGAGCNIREAVTMSIGTEDGGGLTEVGDNGFFMANTHVAHDCIIGRNAVFANSAAVGEHCVIGDYAVMGGLSAAHQFTRIGAHAMVTGGTMLRQDLIPFGIAQGRGGRLRGINVVGMKRRKFTRQSTHAVRAAYRTLFHGAGEFQQRIDAMQRDYGADPAVALIVGFVRGPHHRPLCQPRTKGGID